MLANILHIKEKIINDIKQFFEQNEKPRINFSWSISKCIVQNVVILKDNGQFSSVAQACLTLCDPMDCCTPGFPVHHQLLELSQTHVQTTLKNEKMRSKAGKRNGRYKGAIT